MTADVLARTPVSLASDVSKGRCPVPLVALVNRAFRGGTNRIVLLEDGPAEDILKLFEVEPATGAWCPSLPVAYRDGLLDALAGPRKGVPGKRNLELTSDTFDDGIRHVQVRTWRTEVGRVIHVRIAVRR